MIDLVGLKMGSLGEWLGGVWFLMTFVDDATRFGCFPSRDGDLRFGSLAPIEIMEN